MSSNDTTKVWVKGQLLTLEELKNEFQQLTIAGAPSNIRLMGVLAKTDKPLTRKEIATEIKLSTAYTRTLLKKLASEGIILEFDMKGSNSKYYLLTEKGYELLSNQ